MPDISVILAFWDEGGAMQTQLLILFLSDIHCGVNQVRLHSTIFICYCQDFNSDNPEINAYKNVSNNHGTSDSFIR